MNLTIPRASILGRPLSSMRTVIVVPENMAWPCGGSDLLDMGHPGIIVALPSIRGSGFGTCSQNT